MSETWQWSACEVAEAVATGKVSARHVIESCLQRLAIVNPATNAIVEVLEDEALAQADAADHAVRRGDALPPLHGVPVTTKINVDQKGRATSNGVPAYRNLIAAEDSPVVANLRRAGAIVIGRSNAPEFSMRWFTDNPLYGTTKNPWDLSITAGGSSGGAASAVATGIGALAHGNDSAGSIRYPAYACGVMGLKPSFGRVPGYNPTFQQDRALPSQIVEVQGMLGRNAADLRLGLAAMSGRDPRDAWWVPVPPAAEIKRERFRVAVMAESDGSPCHVGTRNAVLEAAKWLENEGCDIELMPPPRFQETAELWPLIVLTSNRQRLPIIEQLGSERVLHAVNGMLASVKQLNITEFLAALARRDTIAREWQLFFETFDALLMPVSWSPPFSEDYDQKDGAMKEIMAAQTPLLCASILGLPAVSAPIGLCNKAPMGVQIVSARFCEEVCLRIASLIERHSRIVTPIDVQWAIRN